MDPTSEARTLLDLTYETIRSGSGMSRAVSELISGLKGMRVTSDPAAWKDIRRATLSHDLHALLLEDPYTHRAFTKPRGYAGDAVMMDYLYYRDPPPDTSSRGVEIFKATTGSSNGASVRERASLLASRIDEAFRRSRAGSVLSVACGHLRELAATEVCAAKVPLGSFYAADQDPESLTTVEREYGPLGVQVVALSVGGILRGKLPDKRFDFIYAAGLYDYLQQEVAERLTRKLVSYLATDGELLIGNFVPANEGRGYMEAAMDWDLICRSEEDMSALAAAASADGSRWHSVERDSTGNIAYLKIVASG